MNPEYIGRSILFALTVLLILAALWPYIPISGPFSQLTVAIEGVSRFVIPSIVVGAPAVAYYLLSEL